MDGAAVRAALEGDIAAEGAPGCFRLGKMAHRRHRSRHWTGQEPDRR